MSALRLADIEAEWGWIGPLVHGVDPCDNDGSDMRSECREGRSLCFVCEDGFAVVSLQPNRYGNGAFELFIRMAVSKGRRGSIQRNDAHFDAIAKELGASKIVFNTVHPWMQKALTSAWRVRYTVFERDVAHG